MVCGIVCVHPFVVARFLSVTCVWVSFWAPVEMDESDDYMDASLSPVRGATGGQMFEGKYDQEESGYGSMDDSMGSPVNAASAGAASIGGSMYTSAMAMVENE